MRGVGALIGLALRRDRWLLVWWTLGIVALYWSQAYGTRATYGSAAELRRAARSEGSNPALVAMTGPPRALDTIGGQTAWQAAAFGCIALGLLVTQLVARHTRAEEESGRDELVRAGAVSRSAPTVAAVGVVVLAVVVVSALVAAVLWAYGLPPAGSAALGVGLAGCGLVFGAASLLAAQVVTSARGVYAVSLAVIGASFLLRAVGDVGPSWLSWCSPIGWGQALRPFADERWWPALLFVVLAPALTALALAVFARRDVGGGLWAARPGPGAGRWNAWTLPWRLERGSAIGWVLGTLVVGLALGSVGDSVGDVVGDGAVARDVLGVDPDRVVDSFHATALVLVALLAGGYAAGSSTRPRGDELDGRAELVLAADGSRWRWWAAHVSVTATVAAVATVAGGLGLGVAYAVTTDTPSAIGRLALAALSYAPAPLALIALATLLLGWAPRALPLVWAALGACAAVLLLGASAGLPEGVLDLSPFHALSAVPRDSWDVMPTAVVVCVGAAAASAGALGLRRRDLGR